MASSSVAPDQEYTQQEDNKELLHIPGDYGYPWVGKAIPIMTDLHNVVDDYHKKYGEVSRIRLGGQNGLLVVGADNYKKIFIDKDKNYSARMGYEKTLGSIYPDTILTSDGSDHRDVRRMFQTAFKNDAMRRYLERINLVVERNLTLIDQKKSIVFFKMIKQTLMEVALNVFFGIDDLDGKETSLLIKSFKDSSEGLLALIRKEIPGGKFKKGKDGIRYQHAFLSNLIKERRGKEGTDTMTYLCNERDDDGNYFADEMIIKQAAFLLFAAHDTTTSAIIHMVYHSGKNKEWQARMRKEAQSINKAALSYEDLDLMADTDLVFKESLRLHPSVPMLARRTIRDSELGGYEIPANTVVWCPPTFNHYMPEYWTDPYTFDPERFTKERSEQKNHSFCYMPFGGGAHKCIGMHFAAMVAKVFMHQFTLRFEYNTLKGYDPKMDHMPLPKPHDGLPLHLVRL